MIIDPNEQTTRDTYKLLIGSVLPRPIAFVTSQSKEGIVNAAPFSFFNVVASKPPLISVSVGRKSGGEMKDTASNIAVTKEFVVHIVDESMIEGVNQASTDYPAEVSEVNEIAMTLSESKKITVPGLNEPKIRLECKLHQSMPLGGETFPSSDLIIGQIVCFHINDDIYNQGKILTERLDPVGRLAGTEYGKIGKTFAMPRPKYKDLKNQ